MDPKPGMRINFDTVIRFLASDKFREELEGIISGALREEKSPVDVVATAFLFLGMAVCADEKGRVLASEEEITSFVNGNMNYLKCLFARLIPERRLAELLGVI